MFKSRQAKQYTKAAEGQLQASDLLMMLGQACDTFIQSDQSEGRVVLDLVSALYMVLEHYATQSSIAILRTALDAALMGYILKNLAPFDDQAAITYALRYLVYKNKLHDVFAKIPAKRYTSASVFNLNRNYLLEIIAGFYQLYTESKTQPAFLLDPRFAFYFNSKIQRLIPDLDANNSFCEEAEVRVDYFLALFTGFERVFTNFVNFLTQANRSQGKCYVPDYVQLQFLRELQTQDLEYLKQLQLLVTANQRSKFTPYSAQQLNHILAAAILCNQTLCRAFFAALAGFLDDGTFHNQQADCFADQRLVDLQQSAYMMGYKTQCVNLHKFCQYCGGALGFVFSRGIDYAGDVLWSFKGDANAFVRALVFCFHESTTDTLQSHPAYGEAQSDLYCVLALSAQNRLDALLNRDEFQKFQPSMFENASFIEWLAETVSGIKLDIYDFNKNRLKTELQILASVRQLLGDERAALFNDPHLEAFTVFDLQAREYLKFDPETPFEYFAKDLVTPFSLEQLALVFGEAFDCSSVETFCTAASVDYDARFRFLSILVSQRYKIKQFAPQQAPCLNTRALEQLCDSLCPNREETQRRGIQLFYRQSEVTDVAVYELLSIVRAAFIPMTSVSEEQLTSLYAAFMLAVALNLLNDKDAFTLFIQTMKSGFGRKMSAVCAQTTLLCSPSAIQLFYSPEIQDGVAKNLFRRLVRALQFSSVYQDIVENYSFARRYYAKPSQVVQNAQEQLIGLFTEYEQKAREMEQHCAFQPDFRFVADCGPLSEQIKIALDELNNICATTFSKETYKATYLFYSLFGSSVKAQIKMLQACRYILPGAAYLDQDIQIHAGLQIDVSGFDQYADEIIKALDYAGAGKNAQVGFSEVQIEALLARFMLSNIQFAYFYLLSIAGFFSAKGEVFYLAAKMLEPNDIKRNVHASSCIAVLLSNYKLSITNTHKYVANGIYLLDSVIMRLLDVYGRGWKAFLSFLVSEIRALELAYTEDRLFLVIHLVCCLIKYGQRGDRLWLRHAVTSLKEVPGVSLVLQQYAGVENDDCFVFNVVCVLLNNGSLQDLFSLDFAQFKFNQQALLYSYEPQYCVISVLYDFYLLFSKLIDGPCADFKVLENCSKARCQSAIFNVYRINYMMLIDSGETIVYAFDYNVYKDSFLYFLQQVGASAIKQQLEMHDALQDKQKYNLFHESVTAEQKILFDTLNAAIVAACQENEIDFPAFATSLTHLVWENWQAVSDLIESACGEDYYAELLPAAYFLKNNYINEFVHNLFDEKCLHQFFSMLSDNFYSYVYTLDYESALLKFMHMEALVEESLALLPEYETPVPAGHFKNIARNIQKIIKNEPDQDLLCEYLIEQIEKLNQLSESSPAQLIIDALGEVFSSVVGYKLYNNGNISKIIDITMQHNSPPALQVIYRDACNQRSVFALYDQEFGSLFFQSVVRQRQQADYMELMLDCLPDVKKYYKGASIFDSDQFWHFVALVREKEQLLLDNTEYPSCFGDLRLAPEYFAEAGQLRDMVSAKPCIFARNYYKTGLFMSAVFGMNASEAVSYLYAAVDHAERLYNGEESPVSYFAQAFGQQIDYDIRYQVSNLKELIVVFLAATGQKVCFGDDALMLLVYDFVLQNPAVMRFLLLIQSGMLGNTDSVVQKLRHCSHGLCNDARFCWQAACYLGGLDHYCSFNLTALVLVSVATKHVSGLLCDESCAKRLFYYSYNNCMSSPNIAATVIYIELLALAFAEYDSNYLRCEFLDSIEASERGTFKSAMAGIESQSSNTSEFNFLVILLLLQRKQLETLFLRLDYTKFDATCPLRNAGTRWLLGSVARHVQDYYYRLDDNAQTILQHSQFIGSHRQAYSICGSWRLVGLAEKTGLELLYPFFTEALDLLGDNKEAFGVQMQQVLKEWAFDFYVSEMQTVDGYYLIAYISESTEAARLSLSADNKHCTRLAGLLAEVFSNGCQDPPFGPLSAVLSENSSLFIILKQAVDLNEFFSLAIKENRLQDLAKLLCDKEMQIESFYWPGSCLASREFVDYLSTAIDFQFACAPVEPEQSIAKSTNASCFVDHAAPDDLLLDSDSQSGSGELLNEQLIAESSSHHSLAVQPVARAFASLPTQHIFSGTGVDQRCTSFEGVFLAHDTLLHEIDYEFFDVQQSRITAKSISVDLTQLKFASSADYLKMFGVLEIPQQEIHGETHVLKDACDECGAPISFSRELPSDAAERAFYLNQQNGIYCAFSNKCFCAHCAESPGYFEEVLPRSDGNAYYISGKRLAQLWKVFYTPLYNEQQIDLPQQVRRKLRFLQLRLPLIAACEGLQATIARYIDIASLADPAYALNYKAKLHIRAQEWLKPFNDRAEKASQTILKKVSKSPLGEALAQRTDEHDGDFEEILNLAIKAMYFHFGDCYKCVQNFSECHYCQYKFIGLKYNFEMFARFAAGVKTTNSACIECARVLHKTCSDANGYCSECATYIQQFE